MNNVGDANRRRNKRAEGSQLEEEALRILTQKGFRLVERNFSNRWGEVDLICLDKNWLVFVEVKSRRNLTMGYAEEAVTPKKRQTIIRAALGFIQDRNWTGSPVRFDVMAKNPDGWKHFENAFMAEEGWSF